MQLWLLSSSTACIHSRYSHNMTIMNKDDKSYSHSSYPYIMRDIQFLQLFSNLQVSYTTAPNVNNSRALNCGPFSVPNSNSINGIKCGLCYVAPTTTNDTRRHSNKHIRCTWASLRNPGNVISVIPLTFYRYYQSLWTFSSRKTVWSAKGFWEKYFSN